MTDLARATRLTLTVGQRWQSSKIPVDPLTNEIRISIDRPTTGSPVAWAANAQIQVELVLVIDGEEHVCSGRASGGIRVNRRDTEDAAYQLIHHPAVMIRNNRVVRIGETAQTECAAFVRITMLRGSIDTVLTATTSTNGTPGFRIKNSVAYDTSIDATETGGDGVLAVSITGTGTNRFGAVLSGNSDATGGKASTATWAGNALTELWDRLVGSFYADFGARALDSQMGSGSQSVQITTTANQDELYLCAVTFNGVDQTTPANGTNQANGSSNAPSVATSATPGADDMVLDICWQDGSGTLTAPAEQTERQAGTIGTMRYSVSTQAGSSGSTMSRSSTVSDQWGIGAFNVLNDGGGGGGGDAVPQCWAQYRTRNL